MQLQKGFGPIVSHAMLKLVDKRKKESLSNGDLKARVVVLLQTIVLSSLLPKVTLLTRILLLSYFFSFPMFSSSLKEFLPQSYIRVNKIEKKVFTEHKNIQGTPEIDAKSKYVKLARSLPTFGVHFFLVKVSARSKIWNIVYSN